MLSGLRLWWHRLPRMRRVRVVVASAAVLLVALAALRYALDRDGISVVDASSPTASYVLVFLLVTLDGVVPIFPGETTLNAASTAAAQGVLELWPVIVAGALGAVVGDSALFWLARRYAPRVRPQVDKARANPRVAQALDLLDSSAPILIVGGRYVPGLRFVVNATMGLSDIPYRRFVLWSVVSGVLWSVYTCVLAYKIGQALGEYPMASVVMSGFVTTVAIGLVLLSLRNRRRTPPAD